LSERIISSERVRDLTAAPRRIPIEVEGSVTYEIALTIWSAFNPKESNTASELGEHWLESVHASCSDELAAELTALGGPWAHVWLAISSLLLSAPHPHDPDRAFTWLEGVGEQRLRRWILGYSANDDDQGLIEQAASGDVDAAVSLLGDAADEKEELVEFFKWMLSQDGLPPRYALALRRFRDEVFSEFEEEFAGAISRAAAARRAAPVRGSAKEVVEEVTSGIDFEIPLAISRVILVPSVLTRPLSLIDGYRGTLIVYYGIADEFINSDPEAPPSWLVRTYKALSDERRLRIMRRLSESPASLDDLVEMLGLTKSTVHHHITLLRGAGLIRVHIDDDKASGKKAFFSVREQSVADAGGFLDAYLRNDQEKDRDVL
jgi:DNA-binding transcriptional ArsR family regulator